MHPFYVIVRACLLQSMVFVKASLLVAALGTGLALTTPALAASQYDVIGGKSTVSDPDAMRSIPDLDKMLISYGGSDGLAVDPAQPFHVTTWNVYKYKKENVREDLRKFAAESQLLVLQESMMSDDYQNFFESFTNFMWFAVISFFQNDGEGTGVSTGGTLQPSWSLALRTEDREPFVGTPKTLLFTKYPILGSTEELMVVNIHAINVVGFEKFARQIAQIEGVIKDHTGPLIVAGDFNTHTSSRLERVLLMAKNFQLEHVKFANQNTSRTVLDHVFTRGMTATQARVVYEVRSSDHAPLSTTFALQ